MLHSDDEPKELTGNQLLNHLMGVKQIFLGKMDEFERADRANAYAEEQRLQGRKPYMSDDPVIGALGYVQAALELHAQADQLGYDISHLFIAGSMGPTEAGLLWGSALLGKAFTVYTPSVEHETEKLKSLISGICDGISEKLGFTPSVPPLSRLVAFDDFLGTGYDKPTPESLQTVKELASREGLFIETTYNAKVFTALKEMLRQGRLPADEGICIFHTGGIPALFGQASRFVR
jgi:1-aminocyclopropane-1-carboxylate deaminase/D-cysteine desulfhydrase-like pyridoxal-dependent ACC family enzyme